MPTNKIALRTTEEFMSDFIPTYQPIFPLFMGKAQQYAREAGVQSFRRVSAVGDIRAKHVTPKDTEIQQISVMEGKKSFKKYFLANQFTLSDFQDRQGVEEVMAQVLDEHNIQYDEMLMLGGTGGSTSLNNGLYNSSDPNYTLANSTAIASGSTRLYDFHNKVITSASLADSVAGRKVIFFYGTDILPLFDSLYDTAVRAWKAAIQEVLGSNYSLVKIPAAATPSGANGWIVANMDQTKLHHTDLPGLMDQGENKEGMYLWFNFLMGSNMLEVLQPNGVVRQPATLA